MTVLILFFVFKSQLKTRIGFLNFRFVFSISIYSRISTLISPISTLILRILTLIPIIPTWILIISTLIPHIPTPIPHISTLIFRIPTLISRIPILIPRIPILIPIMPTLIPCIPTLIPRIPIIPFIPFLDSTFQFLQIAEVFCIKRCPSKFHKPHRKTPVPESLTQVLSCEFGQISKNTFLHKTPLVAASNICGYDSRVLTFPLEIFLRYCSI